MAKDIPWGVGVSQQAAVDQVNQAQITEHVTGGQRESAVRQNMQSRNGSADGKPVKGLSLVDIDHGNRAAVFIDYIGGTAVGRKDGIAGIGTVP